MTENEQLSSFSIQNISTPSFHQSSFLKSQSNEQIDLTLSPSSKKDLLGKLQSTDFPDRERVSGK